MEHTNTSPERRSGLSADRPDVSPTLAPSLPEDDGMQALREKMREIHLLAASTEEKARKMHLLMTRDYEALNNPALVTQTRPNSPSPDNPYNISPKDLEATYCPDFVPSRDEQDLPQDEDAPLTLGCVHYTRNVKVQCPDCHLWYTCRHCHDASTKLPFPHQLNRQKIQNMLCMMCKTPQAAGGVCTDCGLDTAYYYCPKCKLWDNDSTKRIYHCDDCGICRRGEGLGKDYVHCKRCNVCISISTSFSHPCIERATDCDCPLCLDHLFSSTTPVVSLLCGHYMHARCYKDLMTVTYRCPTCNKSAVNMELQWRKLDDEIRLQPMPEEECTTPAPSTPQPGHPETHDSQLDIPVPRRRVPRKVYVGCNDCGGRGWSNFHWLGLKCSVCDGYNTTQMTPLASESTTRSFAGAQYLQRQHDFAGVDVLRDLGPGNGETSLLRALEDLSTTDERADSAYGCGLPHHHQPPPPQQDANLLTPSIHIPPTPNSPSGRSYFFRAEQEEREEARLRPDRFAALRPDRNTLSVGDGFRNLPYDIIQRFSRSLSPMRYYLEGFELGSEIPSAAAAAAAAASANETSTAGTDERMGLGREKEEGVAAEAAKFSSEADAGEGFWGGDGMRLLGDDDDDDDDEEEEEEDDDDDDDDEDDEDGRGGDESDYDDDDDDESVASETERAEAEEDDAEEAENGEQRLDMELFGHM